MYHPKPVKKPNKRERKHQHAKTRAIFRELDLELVRLAVDSFDTLVIKHNSNRVDVEFLQGILSILEMKGKQGVDILCLPMESDVCTISREKFQSLAESKGFVLKQDASRKQSATSGDGHSGTPAGEALQAEPRPAEDVEVSAS